MVGGVVGAPETRWLGFEREPYDWEASSAMQARLPGDMSQPLVVLGPVLMSDEPVLCCMSSANHL